MWRRRHAAGWSAGAMHQTWTGAGTPAACPCQHMPIAFQKNVPFQNRLAFPRSPAPTARRASRDLWSLKLAPLIVEVDQVKAICWKAIRWMPLLPFSMRCAPACQLCSILTALQVFSVLVRCPWSSLLHLGAHGGRCESQGEECMLAHMRRLCSTLFSLDTYIDVCCR